ncbi:hypothetical protein SRABI130_02901 [Pseudomonas sp. Bi130]|uniref:hypothetical protein n=1 Tax=Pseudomonas sp. Bi130 TaxID=2821122 RepID=UPI001DE9FA88|nr:hypothetical protein [Pseudomonas sp. Bi130]CAH0237339.1 hypothetical protein SRABI130_02901 [Pseudomonas sp. Bi130]
MRLVVAALLMMGLVGCTTPGDLLKGEPTISKQSNKDPKTVALCIYPDWQEYQSTATLSETLDGYRLVSGSELNGQTNDVLDIKRSATGSAVNLFQRMAWQQVGRSKITESINRCL